MSQAAEEATDGAAREPEPEPSGVPGGGGGGGEVLEGKRLKKTVERLDLQAPKQAEKLKIADGGGDKLGDIPRICYQIGRIKTAELKPLHAILFDRPGKISTVKKNLRLFNGFPFPADCHQFARKRDKILKSFTKSKLKVMCGVLDLEKKGTHSDLVDRIMSFLLAPTNSGKLPPAKKKKRSKKKLTGDSSKARTKKKLKPKPRSSSSSPKKSTSGSKSKAIVMDSSSDEDDEDDEEDEKARPKEEADVSDAEERSEKEEQTEKSSQSEEEEEEDDDDDDEEDDDDDEEDESQKRKAGRAKSAAKKAPPTKRQRTPTRRPAPPKKRGKKASHHSDSDSDEKTKTKKPASAKPAAKTKKADSSSNSKNTTNTADDSADDDQPLINIIKKAPRDEQLRETVQTLLKEANLEEMTMKQICQRVFDTYPEHDLSSKKDYIKQTVKSLIT